MHYTKLLEAHEVYHKGMASTCNADYMRYKDQKAWVGSVSTIEVMKLFGFVLCREPKFEGDVGKFKRIYQDVYPIIDRLVRERIEDIDLSEEMKRNLRKIFDKVARCSRGNRYESTAASKIFHTILPDLIVMWDGPIRKGILGPKPKPKPTQYDRYDGHDYAYEFLPLMQEELEEALSTCMRENGLNREEAIKKIREDGSNRALAKLIDEYNWEKYTMRRI